MKLDEAIQHCYEVAEKNEKEYQENSEQLGYVEKYYNCKECAEEHRQLAEWLKDYKRLLEQPPLEKVLGDIKGEIEKIQYRIDDSVTLSTRDVVNIEDALDIIDSHISGKEEIELDPDIKDAILYLKSYRKMDEDLHNIAPKDSVSWFTTLKCLKYWDMAINALLDSTERY